MDSFFKLLGLGLCGALLGALLQPEKKEFAVMVTLACCAMLLTLCCSMVLPALRQIAQLAKEAGFADEGLDLLLKALGITCLGQFSADLCKDAGQQAIAGSLLLATRICVLLMAMPLYIAVFQLICGLLE